MPDTTIIAPVAADPIDRLALGATDVRDAAPMTSGTINGSPACACMAEE